MRQAVALNTFRRVAAEIRLLQLKREVHTRHETSRMREVPGNILLRRRNLNSIILDTLHCSLKRGVSGSLSISSYFRLQNINSRGSFLVILHLLFSLSYEIANNSQAWAIRIEAIIALYTPADFLPIAFLQSWP